MMNKIAYFISDAHLGIEPPGCKPNREDALIEFLRLVKDSASHVVIVGDLFEFWYEYRDYVSKHHFPLFCALADLVNAGVEVHLLRGNHDFAMEGFFETMGVHVHSKLQLEIQGKKIYMAHGDGVIKSDWSYRLYRKILDFPLDRFLFRQLHPDWGMALARFVGRNSRKLGENKEIRIDEYLQWASACLKKFSCNLCVHGHHHIPGIWNVDGGIVASPGEWIKKFTFLQMEKGELSLKSFKD